MTTVSKRWIWIWAAWACALAVVACLPTADEAPSADAGVDGGPSDAGSSDSGVDGGAHDAGADAGCPTPTSCPCFTSHECPEGYRCESQDSSGSNVFCVPGARGQGDAGDVCTQEGDCGSALCLELDAPPNLCSDLCERGEDCPASLPTCLFIGFGVDQSICSP